MTSQSGLRRRIEEIIGKQILDRYCQKGDEEPGPIMLPPIPNCTIIDVLPKDVALDGQTAAEKELQDGYEAEMKVFRRFEELRRNFIVLHQFEYTHEQYSAFLPGHLCVQKKCKKGPEQHLCHQAKGNREGETDFVVLGDNYVAVFEVKGLTIEGYSAENGAVRMVGCYEDGIRQRKRLLDLIKSVDASLTVYEFTVFSNISRKERGVFFRPNSRV